MGHVLPVSLVLLSDASAVHPPILVLIPTDPSDAFAKRNPNPYPEAKVLSPLTLTQLPQLLYPCSHSYCQRERLLLTLTLTSDPFAKPKKQDNFDDIFS